MNLQNNPEDNKLAQRIVGSAIFTGAFIMCCILFTWKLAIVITIMLWGHQTIYNNNQ